MVLSASFARRMSSSVSQNVMPTNVADSRSTSCMKRATVSISVRTSSGASAAARLRPACASRRSARRRRRGRLLSRRMKSLHGIAALESSDACVHRPLLSVVAGRGDHLTQCAADLPLGGISRSGLVRPGNAADSELVEAAHITWRPLGRLLVEQGLLTGDELERALAEQQVTGERLGETIVKLGLVSGPELASALAAQYGIELTTEKGFGTGLRSEIQRRTRATGSASSASSRSRRHRRGPACTWSRPRSRVRARRPSRRPRSGEAALLAQLEEQWAKLAAAEEALAERERELAELAETRARAGRAGREPRARARRDGPRAASASSPSWPSASASSASWQSAGAASCQSSPRAASAKLAELAERRERELAELAERERELTERRRAANASSQSSTESRDASSPS